MYFNQRSYELTRADVIQLYTNYINVIDNIHASDWDLQSAKESILQLDHNELLILQSSKERWEKLMSDQLYFRMELCTRLNKLERSHIKSTLNLVDSSVSNLLKNKLKTMSRWPRPFQLSVIWNHPWQLISREFPDPNSYPESPEYFEQGVSNKIKLKGIWEERSKVTGISGYVITDFHALFQHESAPVTGRWVTTYPEFDYFEFHTNDEPLVGQKLKNAILRVFPLAKHLITTFRPFKPFLKRAVWVIIPKNESLPTYNGILHELDKYREDTEFHNLK